MYYSIICYAVVPANSSKSGNDYFCDGHVY